MLPNFKIMNKSTSKQGTISIKISVISKGVYLFILKLNSILVEANLLAHNNIICFCGQISVQSVAVNFNFSNNLRPLGIIHFASDGTYG